jgi:uroporphyrinogen decarboxylase
VDVIHFEEDLGMQDRPLIGPMLYRQMIKPYHEKLFRYAKSRCDAYILLHTDGAVAPLIPDFIEMGVDAVNPVQVSAAGMDTKALKRAFGQDITFWGAGCDSQVVLPFGAPQEIADEVKRRIDDLAPGGGYVFSPIHNVQAGVPPENVVAMFEAAREHGIYRGSSASAKH